MSKELGDHSLGVESVICVQKDDDGAECSAEFYAPSGSGINEDVIVVRCDQGSCIWSWKGHTSSGGGFKLENG